MTLQEKLEKLKRHACTEQEIGEIAHECLAELKQKNNVIAHFAKYLQKNYYCCDICAYRPHCDEVWEKEGDDDIIPPADEYCRVGIIEFAKYAGGKNDT